MTARRLLACAALAGLGALAAPAQALVPLDPEAREAPAANPQALSLLRSAAVAARDGSWAATERVLDATTGIPLRRQARVEHGPGRPTASDALDDQLLSLLQAHYALVLGGPRRLGTAVTDLVLARAADGWVAGRFWVDRASGLVVRREVLDRAGRVVRRTELLGVHAVDPTAAVASVPSTAALAALAVPAGPRGERLDATGLARLEAQGWPVERALPPNLALYEARWLADGVLQLSFSDGLSTLSLFVQRGERALSGSLRSVGGTTLHEVPSDPARLVWTAAGCTWTLVADTTPDVVSEVVAVLPTAASTAPVQDGMAPRVWRGLARVGAWVNPFD